MSILTPFVFKPDGAPDLDPNVFPWHAKPGDAPPPLAPPTHPLPDRPQRTRSFLRRIAKILKWIVIVCLAWTVVMTTLYRFVTPPRTMFMLSDEAGGETVYQYVPLDYISRFYVVGVLFHEDTQLGHRTGPFHVGDFVERIEAFLDDVPDNDPHGSTIPQQLVKNIFMVRGESVAVQASRKGVEAILSYPFNLVLGDKRQLELYLNYAQFGPNLYGICAASWYYFNLPPWDGNIERAAWLVGLLPAGEDTVRAPGGGIETSIDRVNISLLETIWRANDVIPKSFASTAGWQGMTATVGITDTAAEHLPLESPNSCSTMPDSVAERLAAESATWSDEYLR